MTAKITTETCKAALVAAWSAVFGTELAEDAEKWKRISKSGKKGEPIERVFFHDLYPLQALVVEENGVLTQTILRGFARFDADEESASAAEEKMVERAMSNDGFAFLGRWPLYQPSDFTFKMCTEEEAARDGFPWYELYPKRDFGRAQASYDEQLDYLIASHLPEGDGEVMEGSFESACKTVEEATAALRARGFIADSEYVETTRKKSRGGED